MTRRCPAVQASPAVRLCPGNWSWRRRGSGACWATPTTTRCSVCRRCCPLPTAPPQHSSWNSRWGCCPVYVQFVSNINRYIHKPWEREGIELESGNLMSHWGTVNSCKLHNSSAKCILGNSHNSMNVWHKTLNTFATVCHREQVVDTMYIGKFYFQCNVLRDSIGLDNRHSDSKHKA